LSGLSGTGVTAGAATAGGAERWEKAGSAGEGFLVTPWTGWACRPVGLASRATKNRRGYPLWHPVAAAAAGGSDALRPSMPATCH